MDLHDLLPNVRQLAFLPHIRDLTIAYALAFLIGWNREQEDRSAGMRTFPLVAIAACGFVQAVEGQLRRGAGHLPVHSAYALRPRPPEAEGYQSLIPGQSSRSWARSGHALWSSARAHAP